MIITKQKYELVWIDAYNSTNWTKKKLKESFPITKMIKNYDGWWDCEHCLEIEAESIDDLKVKVEEYLEETGRIINVFSVIDENEETILTEEDF